METYSKMLAEAFFELASLLTIKEESEAQKPKIEELSNKISQIQVQISEYDELESKQKEKKDIELAVSVDSETLEAKTAILNTQTKEIELLKQEKATLENASTERIKLESQKTEYEKTVNSLSALAEEIKSLEKLTQTLSNNQADYKKALEYYENKKKIFDCFITLINNEGYDAATINKVSKITGLSYGSITNIFNTKEDVLLEVLKVNVEAYEQVLLKSNDRMELFLSNIVKCLKKSSKI